MPLNREWPNRGGKPLVSVGINGGTGARLGVFAPAHAVPRRFEAMGLIKRCVSESADERFSHARAGLTAWVSGWYRLKE